MTLVRDRRTAATAGSRKIHTTPASHYEVKKKTEMTRKPPPLPALPWRPVPVDPALTGDAEGGFAGLEELPGCEARTLVAGLGAPKTTQTTASAAAGRMRGVKVGHTSTAASTPTSMEARLAALEAENARLRAAVGETAETRTKKPKKTEKKKKKKKGAPTSTAATPRQKPPAAAAAPPTPSPPPPSLVNVSAWEPAGLGPELMGALAAAGFAAPTAIQALALPPALAGRRDVLGAAPTGSGKTLAYGLAVLQRLLDERAARSGQRAAGGAAPPPSPPPPPPPSPLRALVLCPTRELALQVAAALDPFARASGVRVAPVVGGLAAPKQDRLLAAGPAVVVATPGRLWAEVEGGHPHLGTPAALGGLACLVIDEADRMVADGSFPELAAILGRVEGAQAAKRQQQQQGMEMGVEGAGGGSGPAPAPPSKAARAAAWAGAMQTFVFSATLTLPDALRRRVRGGKGGGAGKGGAGLEALVSRVPLQVGRAPAVVDVGGRAGGGEGWEVGADDAPAAAAAADTDAPPAHSRRRRLLLAPGISEATVRCADLAARDAALAYLLTAHAGKTLIFVNAVSCARRLSGLLRALGLPARPLHAGMQQRARFKALERFCTDPGGILVATDVAARGLDVPAIATVIHYQIPASPDTYVHRCGRTARGVDAAAAVGVAVSLVVPGEAARWAGLMRAMGRGGGGAPPDPGAGGAPLPPDFPIDRALLTAAAERVALATVVDAATAKASRARADEAWRRRTAAEAGLALSGDDTSDDGGGRPPAVAGSGSGSEDEEPGMHPLPPPRKRRKGGGGAAASRLQLALPPAAAAARARLATLLARPLAASGSKGRARLGVAGGSAGVSPAAAAAAAAASTARPPPSHSRKARHAQPHLSAGDRRAAALAAAVAKRAGGGRKRGFHAKGAGRVHRAGKLVVAPAAAGVRAGAVAGGGGAPLAALRRAAAAAGAG